MTLSTVSSILIILSFAMLCMAFLLPPIIFLYFYIFDRSQQQHSVLRNYPILGRVRYIFEQIGPEMRQYFFDSDTVGKPFSRSDYQNIVIAGKYLKTIISFGSKRDFEKPGWYIRNAAFPKLNEEMDVLTEPKISTKRYVLKEEGLFSRKEFTEKIDVSPWLLDEKHWHKIGENDVDNPWVVKGLIGMSAMSYGALGKNAITTLSKGISQASGSWVNTGEGGLSSHHLVGGGDIIMQIGPGLFGVRTKEGEIDWVKFKEKSEVEQVKAFELKIHQGAKIRGGHVEGTKVNPEIAEIRGVEPWKSIDSPNRFKQFSNAEELVELVEKMKKIGGKPVGVKLVMGDKDTPNELFEYMEKTGKGPNFVTVDGGEGGSGATYQEMADSMGLPIKSAIIIIDNALRKYNLRDKVKVFSSGKLFTPDMVAIALSLGADFVNIARGMMISVGCIQAQKCHTNECPVGVATTDDKLQHALVVDEKKYRVMNYIITLRTGLNSLSAASGITTPTQFSREHVIYKDEYGRSQSALELFPYPEN
jgi:glutamate synthase domain-containing protein 2